MFYCSVSLQTKHNERNKFECHICYRFHVVHTHSTEYWLGFFLSFFFFLYQHVGFCSLYKLYWRAAVEKLEKNSDSTYRKCIFDDVRALINVQIIVNKGCTLLPKESDHRNWDDCLWLMNFRTVVFAKK